MEVVLLTEVALLTDVLLLYDAVLFTEALLFMEDTLLLLLLLLLLLHEVLLVTDKLLLIDADEPVESRREFPVELFCLRSGVVRELLVDKMEGEGDTDGDLETERTDEPLLPGDDEGLVQEDLADGGVFKLLINTDDDDDPALEDVPPLL